MTQPHIDALERVVLGAVAITQRAITNAGADLTFVQWRVLMLLGERDEGATVGDIASRMGSNASPASRVVSRLRGRGLVETTKDTVDGRVSHIRLSASGRALRGRVLEHRSRELARVLGTASLATDEVRVIERLARSFEAVS